MRNALVHGGGGNARLEIVTELGRTGVRATFFDQGPGIANLAVAMSGGKSTAVLVLALASPAVSGSSITSSSKRILAARR